MVFSETEIELIEEWAERWFTLGDLLIQTIRTDKPDTLCRKPSQSDELRYEILRSWLIDNEPRFLPLWKKYVESQDWSLDIHEDLIQQIHETERVLHNHNPFHAFYSACHFSRY